MLRKTNLYPIVTPNDTYRVSPLRFLKVVAVVLLISVILYTATPPAHAHDRTSMNGGWHEVAAALNVGLISPRSDFFGPQSVLDISSALQLEYRYALLPSIMIGMALHYRPYSLSSNCVVQQETSGHLLSLTPRLHVRTSVYRDHESFVFFVGPTFSYVNQGAYCEKDANTPGLEHNQEAISSLHVGSNLGMGYETDTIILDKVRLRFFYDLVIPSDRESPTLSTFAFGIGVNL